MGASHRPIARCHTATLPPPPTPFHLKPATKQSPSQFHYLHSKSALPICISSTSNFHFPSTTSLPIPSFTSTPSSNIFHLLSLSLRPASHTSIRHLPPCKPASFIATPPHRTFHLSTQNHPPFIHSASSTSLVAAPPPATDGCCSRYKDGIIMPRHKVGLELPCPRNKHHETVRPLDPPPPYKPDSRPLQFALPAPPSAPTHTPTSYPKRS
ncbi:hypothetical protein E2C01_007696 [Portunus trituberculatus]|uniref:Uncharacterized protein n=1 Tax=Portunus trituberculatus TaxID=210409 RepID=A0A5B7CZY1_PORTR|nr:hypothetical protein [Portunus trituberculatus]